MMFTYLGQVIGKDTLLQNIKLGLNKYITSILVDLQQTILVVHSCFPYPLNYLYE